MFQSIFKTSDPKAATFHPVSSRYPTTDLFGELEQKDTEWLCAGGFVTETQIWYNTTQEGTSVMVQVIHSSVGLWYPQIQLTCKIYNPTTKDSTWRSVNISNFVTPPPGLDKRSSKSDQHTITLQSHPGAEFPESYLVNANYPDLQIAFEAKRPAAVPGFKVGKDAEGGYSYFGSDKSDGYVVHRFWPHLKANGHIIRNGKAESFQGPGMFVHAIQGMRPNLVATRWNFADFQSNEHGGVSAVQMEFTTLPQYGKTSSNSGGVSVNVGSLVLAGKLVAVTAESKWPEDESQPDQASVKSRATHLNPTLDKFTGYKQPSQLKFQWAAPSLVSDAPGDISATVEFDVGSPAAPKSLIDKVDVLAEIPKVLKSVVNYVSGAKPYIYQWYDATKLVVRGPDALIPGLSQGLEITGSFYSEATFISDP